MEMGAAGQQSTGCREIRMDRDRSRSKHQDSSRSAFDHRGVKNRIGLREAAWRAESVVVRDFASAQQIPGEAMETIRCG